ncbi:hypothetical protein ABH948_005669 [Bacillus sp. RC218]|uniref:hypothetical protein n=1 Tax=Bacillus sp. RC218 TaxID=3156282 RepID=UPI00383666B4
MIDKLISQGMSLESEVREELGRQTISGDSFQQWIVKSIFYLEEYHKDSLITEDLKQGYKKMNGFNNYQYYKKLLNTLHAAKEIEDNTTYIG